MDEPGSPARPRERGLARPPSQTFTWPTEATIVVRMTGDPRADGKCWRFPSSPAAVEVVPRPGAEPVKVVPSGDVEWAENVPMLVYVPPDRLDHWRAEFRTG